MCYNTIGGGIYMKKLGYIFLLLLFSFTSIYSIYRIIQNIKQKTFVAIIVKCGMIIIKRVCM